MKRRLALGLILGLLAGVVPAGPAYALGEEPLCGHAMGRNVRKATARTLRVAQFNVLHGQSDTGAETLAARLKLQIDVLAKARVDVVGMQEVSKTTSHGLVVERLADGLAKRVGGHWYWCWFASNPHFPLEPDVQPGGGGGPFSEVMATQARSGEAEFREGIAILSRHEITHAQVLRVRPRSYEAVVCVPPDPIDCNAAGFFDSRSVMWVRIDAPSGHDGYDVYTTHIAHGLTPLSDTTKLLQTQEALDWIDGNGQDEATPDVFVGDFNSEEGSAVHDEVTGAGWTDTYRAANRTAKGFTSDQDPLAPRATVSSRIDYVFARPGTCGLKVRSSAVIANKVYRVAGKPLWPSDHYGLVSEIACGRA